MDIERIREMCLALPHATEDIQWGSELLFRVGRKIFAMASLDPEARGQLSFKCTPERFGELIEREGIIPAPYVARYHWVTVVSDDAMRVAELRQLVRDSYQMVLDKLPRKQRESLEKSAKKPPRRKRSP